MLIYRRNDRLSYIAAEKESPRGIEYRVGDAMAYQPDEQFDIVTAAYLLNYADTEEKLTEMCQAVARSLKPDGRFVTVNNNPSQALERYQSTRKYDFVKSIRGELQPGAAIAYTIFQDGGSFSFDNDYLSSATHERALEAVGLQPIEWRRPKLSPEWDAQWATGTIFSTIHQSFCCSVGSRGDSCLQTGLWLQLRFFRSSAVRLMKLH